jgi:2-keto-3-deoxy-L-rhamnonate aldolase RhmA
MQFSAVAKLKQKLRSEQATFGFWVTLESPSITEILCRIGFDWIVIDAEHGHLGNREIMEHIRVANLLNVVSLVHIAEVRMELITRMLDLGASGVVLPQIRSAADVIEGVRHAKYPPHGTRGLAAERSTRWGKAMSSKARIANEETLVIPMIETVEAAAAIDEILAVPGIDAILFGPADFSSSAGFPGEWEGPGIADQILSLQRRIQLRGIPCAVLARDLPDARRRQEEQFRMIGLGSDTGVLIHSATEALRNVGADVSKSAWE